MQTLCRKCFTVQKTRQATKSPETSILQLNFPLISPQKGEENKQLLAIIQRNADACFEKLDNLFKFQVQPDQQQKKEEKRWVG